MIQGKISELKNYPEIPVELIEILKTFFSEHQGNPPCGRYEFTPTIYCNVEEVIGKQPVEAKLENHRHHIDLQLTMGHEYVGLEMVKHCKKIHTPYDDVRDIEFFDDLPATYIEFTAGDFLWLKPGEAHAPCVGQGTWKKVVFKLMV
ncbi:MAG: YhcH/YjgK/YiaL family protein [Bacteroidales bacterium]|nr:YhcH/YjgK/YiaL family protein [Bacteroidales bacterium]